MHSLLRVLKFAFQDMGRNLGLSFMTVFILVLMLLSVNTLWSVDVVTKQAVELVKGQVNVSFYLSPDVTDQDVDALKKYISSFPQVVDVAVQSRAEVLDTFKQRHQLDKTILQSLDELGTNPFGPTIMVRTHEPEDYRAVMDALSTPQYDTIIEGKSFEGHEEALDRIQTITNRVEKIGLGLSLLFALISFLIIFNTIRVAIFTQRVEISIKRLVGAHNWFIRGPYLVESLVFTIASVGITLAIVLVALRWIDPYVSVVFTNNFSLTNYYESHMLYLFGVQTLAVLALTVISSTLAMRKQLKV